MSTLPIYLHLDKVIFREVKKENDLHFLVFDSPIGICSPPGQAFWAPFEQAKNCGEFDNLTSLARSIIEATLTIFGVEFVLPEGNVITFKIARLYATEPVVLKAVIAEVHEAINDEIERYVKNHPDIPHVLVFKDNKMIVTATPKDKRSGQEPHPDEDPFTNMTMGYHPSND